MPNIWKQAYAEVKRPRLFITLCAIGIFFCVLAPTETYDNGPPSNAREIFFTDHYGRFVNTAVQVALPLLLADKIGLVQLVYVGVSTTLATHTLKRLVNHWELWGVRLGQRPSGPMSRYNMPSGHSSMASCAAYFVGRRYAWWHMLYMLPILLLTMYARVALDAHTVSAVIAGALIGLLMGAIFTSRRKKPPASAAV